MTVSSRSTIDSSQIAFLRFLLWVGEVFGEFLIGDVAGEVVGEAFGDGVTGGGLRTIIRLFNMYLKFKWDD